MLGGPYSLIPLLGKHRPLWESDCASEY
jgi:hypothetical protein